VLPELGAAFGIGGALEGAEIGADAALAEGVLDSSAAGLAGDAFAETAGGAGAFGDLASGVFDAGDVLSFAGGSGDVLNAGAGGTFSDIATSDLASGALADTSTAVTPASPTFASTDAELTGGITGVPSAPSDLTPLSAAGTGKDAATSLTSTLGSTLSSPWTKLALGAAPLALTLGMGEQQLPAGAQQLQQQALALQQQGLAGLADAQAGKLNAGQTAVLAQFKQNATNQWLQTLYNQGVQDPTKDARWPQIQAQIDMQVTQQTAQLIQQNITNALAETGQASTALTAIAQMQMQADQNFTNALIGATKALGTAVGGSSGRTITIN